MGLVFRSSSAFFKIQSDQRVEPPPPPHFVVFQNASDRNSEMAIFCKKKHIENRLFDWKSTELVPFLIVKSDWKAASLLPRPQFSQTHPIKFMR